MIEIILETLPTLLANNVDNPFIYIVLVILALYSKFYKKFNSFIISYFTKHSAEHKLITETLIKMTKSVDEINDKVAAAKTSNEVLDKINIVLKSQLEMTYLFDMVVVNNKVMKTKLKGALDVINYEKGLDNFNIKFKKTFLDIGDMLSEYYTELREQKLNIIQFKEKEKILKQIKFIFDSNGIRDAHDVIKIADTLVNEFNITKQDKNNANLIVQLYLIIVKKSYEILKKQY